MSVAQYIHFLTKTKLTRLLTRTPANRCVPEGPTTGTVLTWKMVLSPSSSWNKMVPLLPRSLSSANTVPTVVETATSSDTKKL